MTESFRNFVGAGFAVALAFYFLVILLRQTSRIMVFIGQGQAKNRFARVICGKHIWNQWPLPVFTYFSHLPDFDLRVFSRQINAMGDYSSWQQAGYRHPGVLRWLFNPDRRRAKVLKDAAAVLLINIRADIQAGAERFLASAEYKLLINSAARRDLDPSSRCQFLICRVFIADLDREPEILFISRAEPQGMWGA